MGCRENIEVLDYYTLTLEQLYGLSLEELTVMELGPGAKDYQGESIAAGATAGEYIAAGASEGKAI